MRNLRESAISTHRRLIENLITVIRVTANFAYPPSRSQSHAVDPAKSKIHLSRRMLALTACELLPRRAARPAIIAEDDARCGAHHLFHLMYTILDVCYYGNANGKPLIFFSFFFSFFA
ncbi:hypothetical protein PUN28_010679 [Cardiocondyla obscurior]|uniref:Uncharacterized protein n=1 Tax=Cardiocondyla obscurior TaxID=286306 RepID=A0AAW2FKL0_9HYME